MKDIGDMLFWEVLAELEQSQKEFTPIDFDRLESELRLRAASLSWAGDPLKQPHRVVLVAVRTVMAEKESVPT